jgi:hypothetical protein
MYTIHHHFPTLILQGHLSCKGRAKMINTGSTGQLQKLTFKIIILNLCSSYFHKHIIIVEYIETLFIYNIFIMSTIYLFVL